MNTKQAILETMGTARYITNEYLADLSDAELLVRPVAGMNTIAWQLGHLIASECKMLRSVGASMPELPAGFEERHTPETAKLDDPGKLSNKQTYLDLWDRVRKAATAALAALPDARLAEEAPEDVRSYAPTVGSVYLMVGMHELMHSGQWVAVRRKLNKPIKI